MMNRGEIPQRNFPATLELSRKNMMLPISMNMCVLDLVFQNYSSVMYSSWRNVLLLISENLCCLISIELAVLYKCWKNCWMNPHVSASFAVFLTEKWTGFPKRCFSPKRLFQIFFPFIQYTIFWVVSTSSFVQRRHISSL